MSTYVQLFATCLLTLCLLFGTSPDVMAADALGPGEFGSLTLCPAGGKAFRMAWSLACEMKRRKRSVDYHNLDVNNEFKHDFDEDLHKKDNSHDKPTISNQMEKKAAPQGYRPATLTEIQKICCEFGCEIRDLLSYCDPFGPWNSR